MSDAELTTERVVKAEVVLDLNLYASRFAPTPYTDDQLRRKAELLIQEIRRHIDIDDVDTLDFRLTCCDVCSFCGSVWEPNTFGCNLCCEMHMIEWECRALEEYPEYEFDREEPGMLRQVVEDE